MHENMYGPRRKLIQVCWRKLHNELEIMAKNKNK
jgi:hypothetical protein